MHFQFGSLIPFSICIVEMGALVSSSKRNNIVNNITLVKSDSQQQSTTKVPESTPEVPVVVPEVIPDTVSKVTEVVEVVDSVPIPVVTEVVEPAPVTVVTEVVDPAPVTEIVDPAPVVTEEASEERAQA